MDKWDWRNNSGSQTQVKEKGTAPGRVSKLSKLSGRTIGPNSLQKVMAGDVLNANANYYYPAAVTNNTNSLIPDIVTSLMQAIGASSAAAPVVKNGTTGLSTNLNNTTNPFTNVADPNRTSPGTVPRAYLNIMFFDSLSRTKSY